MKLLALLPLAVLAADVAVASTVPARHHRIARRLTRQKRCLARAQNQIYSADLYHSEPHTTHPTSTPQQQPTTTMPDQTPSSSPPTSNQPYQPQSGVINVANTCPYSAINATTDPTDTSGPNGSIFWLNCGVEQGGWQPPNFSINEVVVQDLKDVLSRSDNPYENCRQHLDAIYKSASQYGVPPILIAAIAMQESSCNADEVGGNGEQGLMQITPDKCPNGYASDACKDPYTNIDIGTRYFRNTLDSCNGNLPQTIGLYNGWFLGMTKDDATRAASEGRCSAQNNLDYLVQTLDGWMQGVDPRKKHIGVYFNLDNCGGS